MYGIGLEYFRGYFLLEILYSKYTVGKVPVYR